MGKQYNKAEKQKRRTRYLKRKTLAIKAAKAARAPKLAETTAPT
jgi:hypothetical protein